MNSEGNTVLVAQPATRTSPVRLGREQDAGMALFPPGQLSGCAPKVHTHEQSDVTGLVDALAGKAAAQHSHAQSDVTGLSDALAGKADAAALRYDLATRTVAATSGVAIGDENQLSALQSYLGLSDTATLEDIQTALGLADTATLQDAVDAVAPSWSVTLLDRTMNTVTLASGTTSLDVAFPAATSGKARDFFLRLVVADTSLATVSFADGSAAADIEFGVGDLADWNTAGTHLVLFTEIAEGKFLASKRLKEAE